MKVAWLAVSLVLVGGCDKKEAGGGGEGKVASCNLPSVQSCRQYSADNLAMGTEHLESLCTAVVKTATFTLTPCPTDKRIGTCTKTEHKDFFYEGYYEPVASLEQACKDGGGTFAK